MDIAVLAAATAVALGVITIGGLVVKCLWALARLLDDLRGRPGRPGMLERLDSMETRQGRMERALGIEDQTGAA